MINVKIYIIKFLSKLVSNVIITYELLYFFFFFDLFIDYIFLCYIINQDHCEAIHSFFITHSNKMKITLLSLIRNIIHKSVSTHNFIVT